MLGGRFIATLARPWRDRLSLRLVSVVVGLAVVCTATLTWNRYRAAAVALEEQISGIGSTLVDTLAFSCDDKLVLDDVTAIEALVDQVLTEKGVKVAYVIVTRADGKVLNLRNAPTTTTLARSDVREFAAPVLMRPEGRQLGACRIGLVVTPWERILEERAVVLVVQNLATFGLIAAIMGLLLHHWLSVPLHHLDRAVRRIGDGELGTPVPPIGSGQLHRLAATLEQMRGNLLQSHTSLKQQNERLREVDHLKDEFMAHMSHEIRTPLSAILSGAELLPTPANDEQATALEAVQRNGQHLLCLVNQILDFSKLQAGNLALEFATAEVLPLVDDLMADAREPAARNHLELRLQWCGGAPGRIRTDPLRLRQILRNVLDNAVKFTEQGWIEVLVAGEGEGDARQLCVTITDTGIGIPPDQLARLFTPFTQGDASMTRRFGGSGLGLVVSRGLASSLGGSLTLTSEPGRGTQVTLKLPAPLSLDERAAAPAAGQPRNSMQDDALSGRVLLVDDAPDNRRLLSAVLKKVGLDVTTADNGELACAAVAGAAEQQRPFDLVLMDIQMPVLDGHGAAERLRREGFALPIVALTAHATEHDRERCLLAGFDDYASKPISRNQLSELVRRHLQHGD